MKAEEIKAFAEFKKKIEKINKSDSGGAYLFDLVEKSLTIEQNLSSDFPWECGIYISRPEHDAVVGGLKEQVERLQARVDDLEEWDVRELRKRRDGMEEQLQNLTEEAQFVKVVLNEVNEKLNGTEEEGS